MRVRKAAILFKNILFISERVSDRQRSQIREGLREREKPAALLSRSLTQGSIKGPGS